MYHRIPQLRVLITDTKVPRSTKDLVAGLRDRCQQVKLYKVATVKFSKLALFIAPIVFPDLKAS